MSISNNNNSKGNIGRVIQEAWKLAGVEAGVPGLSMPTILEISNENIRRDFPDALRNWIYIFDEFGAWFINISTYLLFF